jgi:hypothetical protein
MTASREQGNIPAFKVRIVDAAFLSSDSYGDDATKCCGPLE